MAFDLADLSSPKSYFLKASFNFKLPCFASHGIRSWSPVTKHYLVESLGNLLWVRRFISSHVDDMANWYMMRKLSSHTGQPCLMFIHLILLEIHGNILNA